MSKHYYNVDLEWTGGRKGLMSSPELNNQIEVATPPEFPGGIEGIWSPEHLFTSAVLSCFMTTFLAIAENSKLEFGEFKCKASGTLDRPDKKFVMSEITLKPELVIFDQKDEDRALRIMEKAEAACLITNSINSTVHLEAKVVLAERA
ncbi:OsmC family protein [Salegentibacter sp. HM20]